MHPGSSPLVSGLFLATSIVGGLAFLFGCAAWGLGWDGMRAVCAVVLAACALPLGPLMLARLARVPDAPRTWTGRALLVSCLALWLSSTVPLLVGGPAAAFAAFPYVAAVVATILAGVALAPVFLPRR